MPPARAAMIRKAARAHPRGHDGAICAPRSDPVKAAVENVSSAVAKSVLVGSWKAVINE